MSDQNSDHHHHDDNGDGKGDKNNSVKVLKSGVTLQHSDPKIQIFEWTDEHVTAVHDPVFIHFQLIVMKEGGCIYVWAGNVRPSVSTHGNLSIALQSKYDRVPVATDIMRQRGSSSGAAGNQKDLDSFSRKMAQRLTMKMDNNLVSYVSYNVCPPDNLQLQMFCESRILAKLREIGLMSSGKASKTASENGQDDTLAATTTTTTTV